MRFYDNLYGYLTEQRLGNTHNQLNLVLSIRFLFKCDTTEEKELDVA